MSAAGPRAAEGSTIFTIRRSRPTADRSLLLGRLLLDRLLFEDIGDRAAVETRPPAVDALGVLAVLVAESIMQIGLLVGADEPVPQQRTDDRVDHDQPGADEQTHRHALRDRKSGV